MTSRSKLILAIAVFLVIGAGLYALTKSTEKEDGNKTNNSSSSEENGSDAVQSASISYTESGFSPSEVTVLAGGVVTVNNQSTESLGFKSDPHPVHNKNTELNLDDISPGQSRTFSVDKKGTWGYHNHLNPDETGTIVVVEE